MKPRILLSSTNTRFRRIVSPEVALNHSEYDKYKDDIEDDQIVIVNEDGMVVHASDTYAPGTITAKTVKYKDEDGKDFDVTSLEITDSNISKTLFENLAQNNDVEWGHINATDASKKEINYLTTSHEEYHEHGLNYILNHVIDPLISKVNTITHSHPNGTACPSGIENNTGDIAFARNFFWNYSYDPKYRIYVPKENIYIRYTRYSVKSDFMYVSNNQ